MGIQNGKVRRFAASDAWSAGSFLYIMLTGRYPFQSSERPKNVKATLQNILSAKYPKLPRSASSEVHDLMERSSNPILRREFDFARFPNIRG